MVEKAKSGYGAYVPDLPGSIAVAEARQERMKLIREAVKLYISVLRKAGQAVPPPTSRSDLVRVRAA